MPTPLPPMRPPLPRRRAFAFAALAAPFLIAIAAFLPTGSTPAEAAPATRAAPTHVIPSTIQTSPQGSPAMPPENPPANAEAIKEIERLFGPAKPFDPDRTVEQLSQCARWQQPDAPDPASASWYRAATTLHAIALRTPEQHQQMLMLYEAAARRGHYLAIKNLTIIYTEGALTRGGMRFKPEWRKARMWINEGLRRQWPGALEWAADGVLNGTGGFTQDEKQGLALMQQAADLGVPLAQYQLGMYYGNQLNQVEKQHPLVACAANQEFSAALYQRAVHLKINHRSAEALDAYQRAIMAGGPKGSDAAFILFGAFVESSDDEGLNTTPDPIRKQAYQEIFKATAKTSDGNPFMTFPRLNEVLPLPPAKVTEWKGIYSAMSPDDAAYYRNPPPPEFYLKDIRAAGYLISDDYLSKPVLDPEYAPRP